MITTSAIRTAAGITAVGALLAIAASSAGATTVTIGETLAAGSVQPTSPNETFLQKATSSSTPSYTVPPGTWTVTSWSIMSGTNGTAQDALVKLRILRPESTFYRVVGESALETVVRSAGGTLRTFNTSIPVEPGDLLGIATGATTGNLAPEYPSGHSGDVVWEVGPPSPAVGQTIGPGGDYPSPFVFSSPTIVNASATLYRDDEPPDTTITGGPGKKLAKGKAKFEFTSSEANSTFECRFDLGDFALCTSPKKYKVKPGKHKFEVEAIDAVGHVDPTPAEKKFKVRK